MTESSTSGITCNAHLALRWTQIDALAEVERDSLAALNEERLRIINGIDEYQPESEEDVVELAVQLQRLEFKVNLALDMLSELLLGRVNAPEAGPVSLSLTRLIWQCSSPPKVGEQLRVEVFLHRRYPFPVVLTGYVDKIDAGKVELHLDGQPEAVRLLLEKFIFRCHRRQIARLRQRI